MEKRSSPTTPRSTPGRKGCEERASHVYSLLQHPDWRHTSSAASLVVPDTPTRNTTGLANLPAVTSVMETPEDLVEVWGEGGAGALPSTSGARLTKIGSSDESDQDTAEPCLTPFLNLRRRKLESILESEYANKNSKQSQGPENSLPLLNDGSNRKERRRSNTHHALWSPLESRRRKSLSHVILPFDLNDPEHLSNKLNFIKGEEEYSMQPATRTPTTTKSSSHITPGRSPRARGNNDPFITPLRLQQNTSKVYSSPSLKGRKLPAQTSDSARGEAGDTTIHFNNEDVLLTPVRGSNCKTPHKASYSVTGGHGTQAGDTGTTSLHSPDRGNPKSPVLQERLSVTSTLRLTKGLQNQTPRLEKVACNGDLIGEKKEGEAGWTTPPPPSTAPCRPREGESPGDTPAAPQKNIGSVLDGVAVYVEVRVERDNRSEAIREQLRVLGAEVEDRLTSRVTHVIFRDGSKAVFKRARKRGLHLLSSLWVEACRKNLTHAPESLYPSTSIQDYTCNINLPGRLRKMKSMQPRDFSEEERLSAARVQRRYKNTSFSPATPTDSLPAQFCTPRQHRRATGKEDVNSPLFGISHLLTPHCQRNASSASSEEEEAVGDGLDNISTPLAKRLYDRFISRHSGSDKKDSQESVRTAQRNPANCIEGDPEPSTRGVGAAETSTTPESLRLRLDDSDSSNTLGNSSREVEMPVRLDTTPRWEDAGVRPKQLENPLKPHATSLKPRRSTRLSIKLEELSLRAHNPTGNLRNVGGASEAGLQPPPEPGSKASTRRKSTVPRKRKSSSGDDPVVQDCPEGRKADSRSSNNSSDSREDIHRSTAIGVDTDRDGSSDAAIPQNDFLSNQAGCSQARRRKLMSVEDDVEPSQDLIMPLTPDPKEKREGPYSHLEAQSGRAHRGTMSFLAKHGKNTRHEPGPSGVRKRGKDVIKREVGRAPERTDSSGDDTVFATESQIRPLPKPRRSTEEFNLEGGILQPKKNSRRSLAIKNSRKLSQICLSSLHSRDKSTVLPIIKKLGGYRVCEGVDHHTTHVVCGEARRTLNLLFGIARGCWVLDVSWVYSSLERGSWAPEENFEMDKFAPGTKICRQQRESQGASYQQTLFSGVGSVCVLQGCSPPATQLTELLELCGASVVQSIRNANLLVGGTSTSLGAKSKKCSQVTHVSEKWVLDSVQQHKVQLFQDYILH